MFVLFTVIVLLILGYVVGSIVERKHYRSILKREKEYIKIPIINDKFFQKYDQVEKTEFLTSEIAIGGDFFKHFWVSLRNIFGGTVPAYESLLNRAKREAILTLKKKALIDNAYAIVNVRITTTEISRGMSMVIAYGTAVYLKGK